MQQGLKQPEPVSQSSEVQSLFTWIQTQFPGIDCEFVVNDSELTGIYIQDPEMKSTFQHFPEVLLSDSTYKTNKLNVNMATLLAETGMDEFDRKKKFLGNVLMNWEEDKECQLVTNEAATVGDDATIQDDLGCEPLNQGEEVTEIHDDDPADPESQEKLEPPQERSPQETPINLEEVVLPTKMRKRGRPKG